MSTPVFKRILLKISGEALAAGQGFGVDPDRVQQIAWEQEPFIYLINKDALVAIAPSVRNAEPSVFRPQAFWNAETLALAH